MVHSVEYELYSPYQKSSQNKKQMECKGIFGRLVSVSVYKFVPFQKSRSGWLNCFYGGKNLQETKNRQLHQYSHCHNITYNWTALFCNNETKSVIEWLYWSSALHVVAVLTHGKVYSEMPSGRCVSLWKNRENKSSQFLSLSKDTAYYITIPKHLPEVTTLMSG